MSSIVENLVETVENVDSVKSVEHKTKKTKLPFGHYKVTQSLASQQSELSYNIEGSEDVVCKPLTQEDYANGWQAVLPTAGKKSKQPIHHWSVTLAQLPPHLWKKYSTDVDEDGNKFHPVIRDGIYHYTVTDTEHDDELMALHTELHREGVLNKEKIKSYVKHLDGVNGWLLIRARKFLKGTQDMGVAYS
jgi:hypothetical protein